MQVWTDGDELFELNSLYALPNGVWAYELTASRGQRAAGVAVLIPDATPGDAPFTPSAATQVRVVLGEGTWPWRVLLRFLRHVEACGDILPDDSTVVAGDLNLSCNARTFGQRRFEVNSYWLDDPACWFYELYELGQPTAATTTSTCACPTCSLTRTGASSCPALPTGSR